MRNLEEQLLHALLQSTKEENTIISLESREEEVGAYLLEEYLNLVNGEKILLQIPPKLFIDISSNILGEHLENGFWTSGSSVGDSSFLNLAVQMECEKIQIVAKKREDKIIFTFIDNILSPFYKLDIATNSFKKVISL